MERDIPDIGVGIDACMDIGTGLGLEMGLREAPLMAVGSTGGDGGDGVALGDSGGESVGDVVVGVAEAGRDTELRRDEGRSSRSRVRMA